MTLLLLHGGGFGASCWDPVLPLLPDTTVAIDLPGRGARPRPLAGITIADFVDAVVEDIEARDLDDVVLVGHSLAGITMPGVAERIPHRLARLVFVSCTVPAEGERIVDTLDPELRAISESAAGQPTGGMLDHAIAQAMFCNDMDDDQVRFTLDHMVPEAVQVTIEPVSLAGLRHPIPRTWIRLERDLIVPPERQDIFIERTQSDVIPLDAGHMAMISRPTELAALLLPLAT